MTIGQTGPSAKTHPPQFFQTREEAVEIGYRNPPTQFQGGWLLTGFWGDEFIDRLGQPWKREELP